jgi:hypothetical protein
MLAPPVAASRKTAHRISSVAARSAGDVTADSRDRLRRSTVFAGSIVAAALGLCDERRD